MIDLQLVPVDDELATLGRCWRCKQDFEADDYYCQVSGEDDPPSQVWITCTGCAGQLYLETHPA